MPSRTCTLVSWVAPPDSVPNSCCKLQVWPKRNVHWILVIQMIGGVCNTTYYCDHPFATWSITFGSYLYELYKDRLDELDDAAFAAALAAYIEQYGAPPDPPPGSE